MAFLKRSPWMIHYDGSSCNGCDIEVWACLTPMYDLERFGVINTGNPKHADILLVTGFVNTQNAEVVKRIHRQMPDPKVVVAVGICAATGNFFRECYNTLGGIPEVIPVDLYVPGCPARPEAIIDGVISAAKLLEEKYEQSGPRQAPSKKVKSKGSRSIVPLPAREGIGEGAEGNSE